MTPLELWAGAECTVNRVGDRWSDQICRTGHEDRLDDLDRIAALGARRVRFPVLWERTAPQGLARADWRWADTRLERLAALGLEPIVGLVHHGSGPGHTHLGDPGFVDGLAEFAHAVASRYPSLCDWTPVNEPSTTARFSALYGHWYPHARDTGAFLRALVIESRATQAAMAAVRSVQPHARLVQTEDLGRTSATAPLAYQSAYENHRRWLSLDLLGGAVDRGHVLREHLEDHGVDPAELDALVAAPCPPDVVGINYYVTSDRFLDHRLELYPEHCHGGNGYDRYADVEAVRVPMARLAGHRAILEETWMRYGRPVAITEVHLGCTREDQLRWLAEAWQAAVDARAGGVDVRAVTLWSVFGAVDWHSLVTREEHRYEPGVYDVRAPEPRPTALVDMAKALARGEAYEHPVLAGPGWWNREHRIVYAPCAPTDGSVGSPCTAVRPIAVVGEGPLARRLLAGCRRRGLAAIGADGSDWPRGEPDAQPPWAWIAVPDFRDGAAHRTALAHQLQLARRCESEGVRFCTFSEGVVFDGRPAGCYVESHSPRAHSRRAQTCLDYERCLEMLAPSGLVVRTGPLLDPEDPDDLLARVLAALHEDREVVLRDGEHTCPSYVPELVDVVLDLVIDGVKGLWHGTNTGPLSPWDLASLAARSAGLPAHRLQRSADASSPGRPAMRALVSERTSAMTAIEDALASYLTAWAPMRPGTRAA